MFKWLRELFRSPKVRVVFDLKGMVVEETNTRLHTHKVTKHYRVDIMIQKHDYGRESWMEWQEVEWYEIEEVARRAAERLARYPIGYDRQGMI